jgi:hypothetical protein
MAAVTVMTTAAAATTPPVTILKTIRRCWDEALRGFAMRTRREDLIANAIERGTRHGKDAIDSGG